MLMLFLAGEGLLVAFKLAFERVLFSESSMSTAHVKSYKFIICASELAAPCKNHSTCSYILIYQMLIIFS